MSDRRNMTLVHAGMGAALFVALLSAGTCRAASTPAGKAASHTTGEQQSTKMPGTDGGGIQCTSGPVYVVEIHAVNTSNDDNAGVVVGSASTEICSTNATKFSDIIMSGTIADNTGPVAASVKTGVEGAVQIHGRTVDMNANIYAPPNDLDTTQCAQQDSGSSCKPHPFAVNFVRTWVFTPGKWMNFRAGTDATGHSVSLLVRLSDSL
ncbi:hypothetical protein JCM25156A_31670 [Komagataeibacter kakiaceti JCM 25156]|uniref:hypothetical protein n=1 Tax=Komagataeibacter kakiaceti TaxID=943261 RepID=UPI0011DE06A3|nr:hypothetical protein [Komagataeibacter kakiaceti]